ncbi:MAG: 16S rRNA (cytosine(1402)-N(4))-methyltransferase RsmH [Chloroflexi bacterium]|nr:16S rRNA (cytosine(1402)-N(4))-methyltransferase RsmH [Chloroflexota bacterium]
MKPPTHQPVLLSEALEALKAASGGLYIDATVGPGGHAAAILQSSSPDGRLLGLDADPEAIATASLNLTPYQSRFILRNGNFSRLGAVAASLGLGEAQGILFDLGLSSLQLESAGRGFSFQKDAPLDMRFGPSQTTTAAQIVNTHPEEELARLLREYGEEPRARAIARHLVRQRPFQTTLELAAAVAQVAPQGHLHPATRTFQALRIAVNGELDSLKEALPQAVALLAPGGRLVTIAYHSLEDRIIKEFLRQESRDCICPPGVIPCRCGHKATLALISKKVIKPSLAEALSNPRSRSARLRVAQRL